MISPCDATLVILHSIPKQFGEDSNGYYGLNGLELVEHLEDYSEMHDSPVDIVNAFHTAMFNLTLLGCEVLIDAESKFNTDDTASDYYSVPKFINILRTSPDKKHCLKDLVFRIPKTSWLDFSVHVSTLWHKLVEDRNTVH